LDIRAVYLNKASGNPGVYYWKFYGMMKLVVLAHWHGSVHCLAGRRLAAEADVEIGRHIRSVIEKMLGASAV
jgi:hypothetical protein